MCELHRGHSGAAPLGRAVASTKAAKCTFCALKHAILGPAWLGPLSFLVLIDGLTAGCPAVKYVDDATLSETFQPKSYNSSMAVFLDNLLALSLENNMELNTSKTKEMVLGTIARPELAPALLTTPLDTVERVNSFKLLGVHIESSLCWSTHINSILKKGTRRMYFLGRNEYLISTLSESAFP